MVRAMLLDTPVILRYDFSGDASGEFHPRNCCSHFTSSQEAFRMANDDSTLNFWSLSSSQLAAQIGLIANGVTKGVDYRTRVEASHLASEWHGVLNLPKASFEDQQRRVAQLDALQKRTIEILVGLSLRE
jgi:hypothetical protein